MDQLEALQHLQRHDANMLQLSGASKLDSVLSVESCVPLQVPTTMPLPSAVRALALSTSRTTFLLPAPSDCHVTHLEKEHFASEHEQALADRSARSGMSMMK